MDNEQKFRTDMELMSAYQRGEEAAFSELYSRYHIRVYSYLQKRIDATLINDLFQDIFLKLHEKKHLYKESYPFAPWFFTLIRHHTIDFFRQKKLTWTELTDQHLLQTQDGVDQKPLPDLESFGLNTKDQSLLYQKFVEGKGYKELVKDFSSSEQNLRKKVSRLLHLIRQGGQA